MGGSTGSVVADQIKFQAKRTVVEMQEYMVHEIGRDDGTLIREYVAPAGKVFGASGPRRAAGVHNSDLVVERSGHTNAFYGRAYLKSMLPGCVTQGIVQ